MIVKLDSFLDLIDFCMMTYTGLNAPKQMNVNYYTIEFEKCVFLILYRTDESKNVFTYNREMYQSESRCLKMFNNSFSNPSGYF